MSEAVAHQIRKRKQSISHLLFRKESSESESNQEQNRSMDPKLNGTSSDDSPDALILSIPALEKSPSLVGNRSLRDHFASVSQSIAPKASPREDEFSRKFYKRFALPDERVIDTFTCVMLVSGIMITQGTLYVTQENVCFYSKILTKKTSIAVPYHTITCIRKCGVVNLPNAIEVRTMDKKYTWAPLKHRDAVFELLDTRWRLIRKKLNMPIVTVIDSSIQLEEVELDIDWIVDEVSTVDFIHSNECSHECKKLVNAPPRISEIFDVSVSEFFNRFLGNNGTSFWSEYIASDGFALSSCTIWTPTDDGCCAERALQFRTPIRATISIYNSTRVFQKHRYHFISPTELIFETTTVSKDVPYSSVFVVDSRWCITQYNETQCEVNVSVGVSFSKAPFLIKTIIEQNAIDASSEWIKNWINTAMAVCIKKSPTLEKKLEDPTAILRGVGAGGSHQTDAKEEESKDSYFARMTVYLLFFKSILLKPVYMISFLTFFSLLFVLYWRSSGGGQLEESAFYLSEETYSKASLCPHIEEISSHINLLMAQLENTCSEENHEYSEDQLTHFLSMLHKIPE